MLIRLAIVVAVITVAIANGQAADPSVSIVRAIVQERELGITSSAANKNLHRMGDHVALIVTQLYGNQLADPRVARAADAVVHEAFAYPQLIQNRADLKPTWSLRLLDKLILSSQDSSFKQRLSSTRQFVVKQTPGT